MKKKIVFDSRWNPMLGKILVSAEPKMNFKGIVSPECDIYHVIGITRTFAKKKILETYTVI